jgi:transposase
MAKFRECDYDQTTILPVSIDNQISQYTLEFVIHHLIEDLDLSYFNTRYNNDTIGRKAINPKVLLKIILLGYSRGLTSSREIEKACRQNAVFMAMTCGDIPDHSTIATFVSSMEEEIAQIFTQILTVCDEEGLIGGTHFSLDGVKLPSNASKECSGKFDELKSRQEKIEKKIREIIKEHNDEDKGKKNKKDDDSHQKRLNRLKQKAGKINSFLGENKPRIGTSGKEVQSNTTDNESAKMVGSHGMVLQGYNANGFVDEKKQVITHAEAFGENEDSQHIRPMLEGAKKNLEQIGYEDPLKGKIISADSGYHSTESLKVCEEYEVDAYIPDKGFRKRDERLHGADKYKRATNRKKTNHRKGKGLFTVKDFVFNENGRLICPAGKALYIRNRNFETRQGFKGINYQAPITACRNCELKHKCLRKQTTISRQVHIFEKTPGNLLDRMKEKIDSPEGRKTYSKRLGIVEPVFANIRARKKMNRFTLRGKTKVNIQWKLYCIVHNLEKIANFGSSFGLANQ